MNWMQWIASDDGKAATAKIREPRDVDAWRGLYLAFAAGAASHTPTPKTEALTLAEAQRSWVQR